MEFVEVEDSAVFVLRMAMESEVVSWFFATTKVIVWRLRGWFGFCMDGAGWCSAAGTVMTVALPAEVCCFCFCLGSLAVLVLWLGGLGSFYAASWQVSRGVFPVQFWIRNLGGFLSSGVMVMCPLFRHIIVLFFLLAGQVHLALA